MTTRRVVTRASGAAVIMACAALGPAGCATAPPLDNPVTVRRTEVENPVLVSPGQPTALSYREVFEKCVEVLDDYFDLNTPNPYEGRITTKPRVAPGYEQFWKAGNPDPRLRLLATFQSTRQTASVEIRAAERGGYLVYVVVDKELEDVPRPSRATIGNAVFQEAPTVDRQVEVVTPETAGNRGWIRTGRDYAFEQQILRRIRECR
ncbi:hypothetical protein R5W24_004564 [Gemmata sp. JC717]|uniref:Lipoprotein n=1 Tax=Gemmata algarum TaxID=2975278 RepID=A0ABU5F5Y4_9BACT|nr:hypothetical protein [Gemmata algarum]MDY3555421.1 hypothetical protein [Gemmata algarum]MDY3562594.1 hypothetical protein [Gemmata algarum]